MKEEYEKNWWITEAMIRFGGNFVRELGKLYRRADQTNASRLRSAFPDYWEKYEKLIEKTKKEGKNET